MFVLEYEHQDTDDDQQSDEEDETDCAADKFQHGELLQKLATLTPGQRKCFEGKASSVTPPLPSH